MFLIAQLQNFSIYVLHSQLKRHDSQSQIKLADFLIQVKTCVHVHVSVHTHMGSFNLTLITDQQMHYIKFHTKTLKIAQTSFDPKIILRELRCSLMKSF